MAIFAKKESYTRTNTVASGEGAYIAIQTQQNAVWDEEKNISIPIQLPNIWKLENIKENNVNGTGAFQEALCRGNDWLHALQARADKMKPGDELVIGTAQVVLRKAKTSQADERKEVEFTFE